MQTGLKRRLVIGTTALAAAAFAGGAYAAAQDPAANARQALLNDAAKRLGVKPAQLSSALQNAYLDQLQAAVAAGKLTQAQANAIKQRIQQGGGVPWGGGRWFGPRARGGASDPGWPGAGAGPGWAGPGGPGGPGGGAGSAGPGAPGGLGLPANPRPGTAGPLAGAADYLGVSASQLFDQLASGKSLAQIAQAHGKSVAGLKDVMTTAARSRLDKLVAAKVITSAQEQKILSELSTRIDNKINRAGWGPRFGLHRMFGGRAGSMAIPAPPGKAGPASGRTGVLPSPPPYAASVY